MAKQSMQMQGLRELGQNLKQLKTEMQQRIARRATNAGAQIVKDAVVAAAGRQPTLADEPFKVGEVIFQPGHIARNVIVKRIPPAEADDTAEHIVTIRSNKANGYAGRIASLNEFGTVKMPPQPFMRPGFDESKTRAADAVRASLGKSIASAAKASKRPRK